MIAGVDLTAGVVLTTDSNNDFLFGFTITYLAWVCCGSFNRDALKILMRDGGSLKQKFPNCVKTKSFQIRVKTNI